MSDAQRKRRTRATRTQHGDNLTELHALSRHLYVCKYNNNRFYYSTTAVRSISFVVFFCRYVCMVCNRPPIESNLLCRNARKGASTKSVATNPLRFFVLGKELAVRGPAKGSPTRVAQRPVLGAGGISSEMPGIYYHHQTTSR